MKISRNELFITSIPFIIFIIVIALVIMGIIQNIDYIIQYKRGFLIFGCFFAVVSAFMRFCLKGTQEALDRD